MRVSILGVEPGFMNLASKKLTGFESVWNWARLLKHFAHLGNSSMVARMSDASWEHIMKATKRIYRGKYANVAKGPFPPRIMDRAAFQQGQRR